MNSTLLLEISRLKEASVKELKTKYEKLFKEKPPSSNREHLWRKIAFRLQENHYGGLSPSAKLLIENEVANLTPHEKRSKTQGANKKPKSNRRIPPPGSTINRDYKGRTLEVKVLEDGFEFEHHIYQSLSAVAKKATGSHWNGYVFFNL